jgi:hypothetical protein
MIYLIVKGILVFIICGYFFTFSNQGLSNPTMVREFFYFLIALLVLTFGKEVFDSKGK